MRNLFPKKLPRSFCSSSIHSIVIRCPNWIGDAVMATPIFAHVKRLFPNARITAVADQSIAQLLEDIPGIDEWMAFSRTGEHKSNEHRRILKELAARHFDLGILLTRSFSSAWMFWKAGVRWRVGFSDHFRRLLLNIPLPLPKGHQHDVYTYLELLRPFGPINDANSKLTLALKPIESERIQSALKAHGWRAEQKLIVLNPGAAYGSAKCWPKEYFHEVAVRLSQEPNLFCVFIGDTKTAPLVEDILSLRSHTLPDTVISLAGKTSLRDLMALLALADCVVTNDSGPMHIAAAFRRPIVALFGSTDPIRTGPWNAGKVLYAHVACSPCFLRTCPKNFQCMRSIQPHDVISAVFKLLGTP